MGTEEQLVYELLSTITGGQVSNDDKYSERLMRSFIRKHRAAKLVEYYALGMDLDDYIFQNVGLLQLDKVKNLDFKCKIPQLIHFSNNYGLRLHKNDYFIPVVDKHAFELSKLNIINKSIPKATVNGNELTVYVGYSDFCNFFENSSKEIAVKELIAESEVIDDVPKIYCELEAILFNPDDALNYDWTRDVFPCPPEIFEKITTSTLARDLDLMLRAPSDGVSNMKQDKTDFDDTIKVR